MGKAKGDNKNLSGKIGTKIYLRRKDGITVVYEAPDKKETPTRSEAQMQVRMQWSRWPRGGPFPETWLIIWWSTPPCTPGK